MRRHLVRLRRQAGHTLVEAAISATVIGGILLVSFPVFKSIGDVGDEGSTQLTAQAENHAALLRLASELQNASTSATDATGAARLLVTAGVAPQPKLDPRNNSAGGFRGRLGNWDWSSKHTAPDQGTDPYEDAGEPDDSTGGEEPTYDTNEQYSKGAASGNTRHGRQRSSVMQGSAGYGAAANRPRYTDIATNSVLTFQRVVGYGVDASGGPEVQWGSPIRYEVIDDQLVRTQDGNSRVVAPFVTGFRAALSDTGTVLVTIVTQKQGRVSGEVKFHANQIEVIPKN